MHCDAAEGEEPGARGAGALEAPHDMIDALIDTLALGTTVTLGVVLGGIALSHHPRSALDATARGRFRVLVPVLALLGGAEGTIALLRATRALSSTGAPGLPPAVTLGIAVLALVVAVWGWSLTRVVETTPAAATLASPSVPPSGATATAVASTEPATTVRAVDADSLARAFLEAQLEPDDGPRRDLGDFDQRLMHANRMQSIGRLAGGIAHDFNNLLTSILTSAEMAREAIPDEHGIAPDLEEIRRAGTRASELTRQLLAFARRDVSRPRVIDTNMLVSSLAIMLRRLLGETIALRISLGHDLPLVLADPSQLEQVIVNLAVNARDAMPHGGELQLRTRRGEARHTVAGELPPAGVVLEVQDSGMGMSEDVRSRLFEPFFTTKMPGRGTGLGLATCQAIVVAHGGEIEVASALGAGSTFRVWLPATEEVVDSRGTMEHPIPPTEVRESPRTILLVEDDPDVRGSTARALRRAGYEVIDAVDGEDALQQVAPRTTPVDLIITDIVMPRLGGAEMVRRLLQRWPDVQVLYMSGYPGDAPEVAQVEAMGVHVLEKPYTPAILLFEIRLKFDAVRRA